MIRFVFVVLVFSLMVTCAYDSEEDLFGQNDCSDDEVSYRTDIIPILQNNCFGCHGEGINTGGVTLEGYGNTLKYVENGRLLGAIKRESGFSPMPQGAAMLPECPIRQIESWIDDGAANN
jgi:mono/diheme cytochrome c family protein